MLERRDLATGIAFSVLGVPATVTRPWPDDTPIATTGIWCTPVGQVALPMDADVRRRDRYRVIALPVSDVPTVPRGTVIEVSERAGEAAQRWRADGIEYAAADHKRVIVVPETEP